jgi:cobyrinic acid a,c-diamide synthase
MSVEIPRILIAGAHSGSGKTTLTLALVAALRRRGMKVQTFKVGPDYLDPTWLTAVSGRPCYNLDGWMCGKEYVTDLFTRMAWDADIAVIEGVMGLFDGAEASGLSGSSAEVAAWLQVSVMLVVNTHGMARSIAPLVAGFTNFHKAVRIGGVIANQCGSKKHGSLLEESLRSAGLPPLAGAVPRGGVPELPSRHLGLVTANSAANCGPSIIDAFADAAEEHLDLESVVSIARQTPPLRSAIHSRTPEKSKVDPPIRLAVALDEAFHFYYQDLFNELDARGAEIEYFSPLRDEALPQGADALYLGGGYPEAFAQALSENEGMLRSIRDFSMKGCPVYAECGGLIYLSRAVSDRDGNRYPLLGILPGETRMLPKLKRLGYVVVTLREETPWGAAGAVLRGHEFHYSELLPMKAVDLGGWSTVYDMSARGRDRISTEGFYHAGRRILTSYVHLHLASRPEALDHFVDTCLEARAVRKSG